MAKSKRVKAVRVAKDAIYDRLYRAVAAYVESKGGKVIVIGGVGIMQQPYDLKYNYQVFVRCTGRLPSLTPVPAKPRKGRK